MNYGTSAGGERVVIDQCQLAFEEWLVSKEGQKYANWNLVRQPGRGAMLHMGGLRRAYEDAWRRRGEQEQ